VSGGFSVDRKRQELLSNKLKGARMKFTGYAIKRAMITVVGLVLTVSTTAVAQEIRAEVSVQGTGLFTKDSSNNGIQNHSTDSGGVLIGYRQEAETILLKRIQLEENLASRLQLLGV